MNGKNFWRTTGEGGLHRYGNNEFKTANAGNESVMTQASELTALINRLDISGADRTRWPAQERLRFAPLIAGNEEAQRLLAEAAAFDKLLDQAPAPNDARYAGLIDRIVAAADAERTAAPGNVVPITAGRRASAPVAQRRTPVHQRSSWQAAALLAASLFVGAFVGTSGLLNQAIPSFGEVDVAEADVTELVIDGNRSSLIEEDLL